VYTIGQFSRITGLSIKTIRLYHEKGVLPPRHIDQQNGYRYFDQSNVERAIAIVRLRDLQFPLAEIKEMLDDFDEDADVLGFLEKQRGVIRQRMERLALAERSLDLMIRSERESKAMLEDNSHVVDEKHLEDFWVAGIRWRGKYDDTGKAIGQIARRVGRHVRGKPMNLYYDGEYREDDADIESCFPVGPISSSDEVLVHRLPGGRCVYLVHHGAYDQLSRSYARIMQYIQDHHLDMILPIREIYLKGPGMIFRGNPKNYLTEIQIMVTGDESHEESSSGEN